MTENRLGSEYKNFIVSEGTLIPEDIVDKISLLIQGEEIVSQTLETYIDEFYEELAKNIRDNEDIDYIYSDILDTLDDIAPDGCRFGGAEGDPACIGFWEIEEEW